MIEFDSLNASYRWHIADVLARGQIVAPQSTSTIEVNDCALRLSTPLSRLVSIPSRRWSLPYAMGEALWHISGSKSLEFISYYSKRWIPFSADGIVIEGSCYGHKIFAQSVGGFTRWEFAKRLLMQDPDTRRCVITMYQPDDLAAASTTPDLPCCNLLHFLIRDGRLCLTAYMRSNDLMYGFGYDICLFTLLQERMAIELGIPVGWYQHVAGSLHIYQRDIDWAAKIANDTSTPVVDSMPQMEGIDELDKVIAYESAIRSQDVSPSFEFSVSPYWRDILIVLLAHKMRKSGDAGKLSEVRSRLQETAYSGLIGVSKGL